MADSPHLRIKSFLAQERTNQVRFLAELVKAPSDNPSGDCAPHARRVAELLRALSFSVEEHTPPKELVENAGMVSCINLLVREQFGAGGPTIALNAHGDAVPPGLGWSQNPYGGEVVDGYMYGRGVAVSKSDFATYVWALRALKASGGQLSGSVELHLTYDEEAGGTLGPKWLLQERITRPDFAICAGFSYGIVTSHNGCLHVEIEIRGKSGHAAEPEKGHDALEAAARVLTDLYAYRKALTAVQSSIPGIGSPTLVVGLISGGINTNVVPDRVVFRIDRRIVPDENPADAERYISALVKESVRPMLGIQATVKRILLAAPFIRRPGHEHMVHAIEKNAEQVFGVCPKAHGLPLYTDARHYSEAGIPTVLYGAGPRTLEEANAHRADEKLKLDDLYKATEVIALTLLDLLDATAQEPRQVAPTYNSERTRESEIP